jgi:hypothetical protein
MMKPRRVLFFVFLFLLFSNLTLATEAEEEEKHWSEVASETMADEAWPRLWFEYWEYHVLPPLPSPAADQEREHIDDRGYDAFEDTAKDVAVVEAKRSAAYKWAKEKFERFTRGEVAIYQEPQIEGDETARKLTIDAGWSITDKVEEEKEEEEEDKELLGHIGFRFRDNPAIYLQYPWLGNGNGEKLEHDWSWYPNREAVEYQIDNMPIDLDFKLKYYYQKKKLKFRFKDLPIWGPIESSFSVAYNFPEHDLQVHLGFYAFF